MPEHWKILCIVLLLACTYTFALSVICCVIDGARQRRRD